MRVLLLGGTGAMGMHLVQVLSEQKCRVTVTSRVNRVSKKNVEYIQGNAKDILFLKLMLKEHWDVIVDFMVYETLEFEERIDFLLKASSQYVYISSARVYACSKDLIIEDSIRLLDDEHVDVDFLSTDEYCIKKARQENILSGHKSKNYTIIRPYITYSESRLQLGDLEKEEWLYRAIKGRTIVFSEDVLSKRTTMTYGLDVSKGISAILNNSKALGKAFHITTGHSILWKEVLAIYMKELSVYMGYTPKVILEPLERYCSLKSNHRKNYQVRYDRLYNRQFNNCSINNFVNIDTFIDSENGLKMCLKDFLKNLKFSNINWKLEARMDAITGERTPLSEISGGKQRLRYLYYRYIK